LWFWNGCLKLPNEHGCCATLQHMNTRHPFYGFTPERHGEVDAQLERMERGLTTLLAEYRRATAPTNLHGYTPLVMEHALTTLRQVRLALQEEQDRPRSPL
jgi:hypothetical protein